MRRIASVISSSRFLVLADQAVFSGGSFVLTILLARLMPKEDFGAYAGIVLLVYFVINLINSLVIQPLQVRLGKVAKKEAYLSFSFWLQLALVTLALIIAYLFTALDEFSGMPTFPSLFFAAGFLFQDYFRKVFLANNALKKAFITDFTTVVMQLGLTGFLFLQNKGDLAEVLTYLSYSYFPAILVGTWFIAPLSIDLHAWKNHMLQHYQQGRWLFMSATVQWWSSNLFVVASGMFLGLEALGAFRLVQSLFGVLNILLQTFENYVLPRTSDLMNTSTADAKAYLKNISLKSAAIFGFVLLITFFFSRQIITLAGGPEYAPYAYVVKGMSILYLIIFIGYPIRMAIRALILNRHFFIGYLLSLTMGLFSFQFLLERFQLMGAISGLIISQLILLLFWQAVLTKNNFLLWK